MSDKPKNQPKPSDSIEEKSTEKDALNPDVAEKSQTDAKGKAEIDKEITNASSGSLGFDEGITAIRFEIADEGETIASKEVRSEQSDADDPESDTKSLTVELEAIKKGKNKDHSELAQNIEVMRTQAKGKGISTEAIDEFAKETFSKPANPNEQFERGSHKSLAHAYLAQQSTKKDAPLDPNDQPVGGYEQENRADGGVTLKSVIPGDEIDTNQRIRDVFERVSELPLGKQIEVIGTGVTAFQQELANQGNSIWQGTQRGVNKSVMGMVHDVEGLANGIGQIWQFGQDVMTNNPRAIETGAKTGDAIGQALVSGIKVWRVTESYLGNVGATGDYSKPFQDLSILGSEINKRWQALSPGKKAEVSSELLTNIAVPGAAGKLAKSTKFIERLEDLTDALKKLKPEDKNAFCKKLGDFLDDIFKPPGDGLKPAYATAGDASNIPDKPKEVTTLFSKKHSSDRTPDKPKNHRIDDVDPFEKFQINKLENAADVVPQHHENACVSACGEMLTEGAWDQKSLHKELMEYFHPTMRKENSTVDLKWLAQEFNRKFGKSWKFRELDPFDEQELRGLLNSGKSWATEIRAYGKNGHAVVIDGLSKQGNIIIRDPKGAKYEMKVKDFMNECWSGRSVFRY